jgi:hypothetical protein
MTNKLPIKFAETIKESIGLKRFGDIVELYKTIDFLDRIHNRSKYKY